MPSFATVDRTARSTLRRSLLPASWPAATGVFKDGPSANYWTEGALPKGIAFARGGSWAILRVTDDPLGPCWLPETFTDR